MALRGLGAAHVNLDRTSEVFSTSEQAAGNEQAEYTCPVCLGLLETPTRVICNGVDEGHKACKACLEQVLATIGRCPVCNVRCEQGAKDGALIRRMKAHEVRCKCCSWVGLWEDRASHAQACAEAARRLGWRCPVEGCGFTARTEREVEVHLLVGLQDHMDLVRPVVQVQPSFSCKDTAQVYIPDLAEFHARGEAVSSGVFCAADGYLCHMAVAPKELGGICVILKFVGACAHIKARFPFQRPFSVLAINPDTLQVCHCKWVDHHIWIATREGWWAYLLLGWLGCCVWLGRRWAPPWPSSWTGQDASLVEGGARLLAWSAWWPEWLTRVLQGARLPLLGVQGWFSVVACLDWLRCRSDRNINPDRRSRQWTAGIESPYFTGAEIAVLHTKSIILALNVV